MRQSDAIIKALLARGEQEVTSGSASKFRKFTRQYLARRASDGRLVTAPVKTTFWFVSRNGSLRLGATSSQSRRALDDAKQALIQEAK